MVQKPPVWAEQALSSFAPQPAWGEENPDPEASRKHNQFCQKIRNRWTELEVDFCPSVKSLPDEGKKIVLEAAIHVGLYQGNDELKKLREAKAELESINGKITDGLASVAKLMRQRDQLKEDYGLSDSLPSVFDVIKSAATRFQTWSYVANKEITAFLRQRGQSRPKPGMLDLIECFVELSESGVFSENDRVISSSRKNEADHIRSMLGAMSELRESGYDRFGITDKFKITDKAVAALVTVLFDLAASGVNAGTVKKRRQDFEK